MLEGLFNVEQVRDTGEAEVEFRYKSISFFSFSVVRFAFRFTFILTSSNGAHPPKLQCKLTRKAPLQS